MAVTLNETTLASAVSVTDDRIKLASGATVAKGHTGYIAREAVLFLAQVSDTDATLWLVARGRDGTPALAHNSGAKVKTGPAAYFGMFNRAGAANAATELAIPWVNVISGDVFDINTNAWRQVGFGGVAQGTAAWP
jgi:hypothetical protein